MDQGHSSPAFELHPSAYFDRVRPLTFGRDSRLKCSNPKQFFVSDAKRAPAGAPGHKGASFVVDVFVAGEDVREDPSEQEGEETLQESDSVIYAKCHSFSPDYSHARSLHGEVFWVGGTNSILYPEQFAAERTESLRQRPAFPASEFLRFGASSASPTSILKIIANGGRGCRGRMGRNFRPKKKWETVRLTEEDRDSMKAGQGGDGGVGGAVVVRACDARLFGAVCICVKGGSGGIGGLYGTTMSKLSQAVHRDCGRSYSRSGRKGNEGPEGSLRYELVDESSLFGEEINVLESGRLYNLQIVEMRSAEWIDIDEDENEEGNALKRRIAKCEFVVSNTGDLTSPGKWSVLVAELFCGDEETEGKEDGVSFSAVEMIPEIPPHGIVSMCVSWGLSEQFPKDREVKIRAKVVVMNGIPLFSEDSLVAEMPRWRD